MADSCNDDNIVECLASRILDGPTECQILALFCSLFVLGSIQLYFSLSGGNEIQCFENLSTAFLQACLLL